MDPAPGAVVAGRYQCIRELARRGATTVWEADDPILNRRVAVKFLHRTYSADPEFRAAVEREIVHTAGLVHPNIVAIYDAGNEDDVLFVVTELVDGTDVATTLAHTGAYPVADAVAIAQQVATALVFAHQRNIVHGNLKPSNVLVTASGHVKISDFALAVARTSVDATEAGTGRGTARYLAPEQVTGAPADDRADVYALALILYEMLAGAAPGADQPDLAAAMARVHAAPPALHRVRPDVPPRLEAAIDRSLAPHPADRFDAFGFRAALEPFNTMHTPPGGTPIVTPVDASMTTRTRDRRPLVALIVLIVLALGLAAFALRIAFTSNPSNPSTTLAPSQPLPIAAGRDFDPEGDNGRENPNQVRAVTDGDPATAWNSETYTTADFGGGKAGLGIILELDGPHRVNAVRVVGDPGWSAEVAVADTAASDRSGFGSARATITDAPAEATLTVAPPVEGRQVLVWFTRLGGPGRLRIAEIQVLGS
ncbi:MAG: serine/threonine-protein kinase [Acidimicrobiia bacterium]